MPERKIRSLCSGCFREGKNLKRIGTYFKRDFFDFNFMCCSQNCASHIKSKKPYSTLINNWQNWAPTISVTWIIAYQIYKNLVKNNMTGENHEKIYEFTKNSLLHQVRLRPDKSSLSLCFVLPILYMHLREYKMAFKYLKWCMEEQPSFVTSDRKEETEINHHSIQSNCLWITKINNYHSSTLTKLSDIKHREKWIQTVAVLLARLRIYLIEDVENLLVQKRDFFRQNRISVVFENNPRVADLFSMYFLGANETELRSKLKRQESHLMELVNLLEDNQFDCDCDIGCDEGIKAVVFLVCFCIWLIWRIFKILFIILKDVFYFYLYCSSVLFWACMTFIIETQAIKEWRKFDCSPHKIVTFVIHSVCLLFIGSYFCYNLISFFHFLCCK